MTIMAHDIRMHLPHARRFARALCGSQGHGDALVARALEALVADRAPFDEHEDEKIVLYTTLLNVWRPQTRPCDAGGVTPSPATVAVADRNLQAMSPKARVAFLLVSLEGFSLDETAEILGLNNSETCALIQQATDEFSSQIATEILIIEDEPLVAMDLEATMEELGHTVIGIAATRQEALALARTRSPGLILADIQLADGSSGIDAVNDMLEGFQAPVIFITAFPDRLLTGEKPEPAFLITKPFDPNMVRAMTSQAIFFGENARRGTAA